MRVPRPRWGLLYGIVLAGLAGLTVTDVAAGPIARPALESVAAGAVLIGVATWIRGNRVALDQQDWCECAAESLTVRVIASRRRSEPDDQIDRGDELDPARLVVVWAGGGPVNAELGTDDHAAQRFVGHPDGEVVEAR